MFQVNTPDNTIMRFVFGFPDKHKYNKNQKITICKLFVKTKSDENFNFYRTTIAYCNHDAGDTFSKLIGKKECIKKMVSPIKDKSIRTLIWKSFLESVKK